MKSVMIQERSSVLPYMASGRDYYVYLVCPRCFQSKWVIKRNLEMSREEVLNTFWKFKCAVHGLLREKPLQVSPKKDFKDPKN